jgi:hypothetical protein
MMGIAMVSLSRRQVLIGGIAGVIAPAIPFPAASAEKLILSGRVVRDGKPVAGASLAIGGHGLVTDADGRFMLVTDTGASFPANAQRDDEGAWRATLGLTL